MMITKWTALLPLRRRTRHIRQFGAARLVKHPNGQHELLGGTDADRVAAFEWVSLFAHEIVFTHFHRDDGQYRVRRARACGSRLPLAA
ncbi:MAG TPA: hypothetical protein VF607_09395 [Verrucomicrobiae bacterium]